MSEHHSNAPSVLIAADIFGATPALFALAKALGQKASVIDAYGSEAPLFSNEALAYEFFCQQSSVHDYATKIYHQIRQNSALTHVMGLSVGASALWHCLTQHPEIRSVRFIGFYGGQVRHLLPAAPSVPIEWYSACHEAHFDVIEFNTELHRIPNVKVHQTDYLHGFMNQHSANFDSNGYTQYAQELAETLQVT